MANRIRWEVDRNGRVIGDGLTRLLGVPILTRTDYLLRVHPEDQRYLYTRLRRSIETGSPYYGTVRILCGDGRYRLIKFGGHLTVVEGVVTRIIGNVMLVGACEEDRPMQLWGCEESIEKEY